MLHRAFLGLLLILLFGLGQQGALQHDISHYRDLAPSSQQNDKAPHSPVCDKCLAFAKLANGFASSDFTLPELPLQFCFYHAVPIRLDSTSRQAYSARAPPAFT